MSDIAFSELNVDIHWKRLAAFRTRLQEYRWPDQYQGAQIPLRVFFIKPTGTDSSPYTTQDWGGDALSVGVNTTALTGSGVESSIALTTTWDWNSTLKCFEGELDLSAPAVDTFLATSADKYAYLEVRVTHAGGGRDTYLQQKFRLRATAIEVTAAEPPAGNSYIFRGEADQLYAKRNGMAGERQRWTNDEGTYAVERWVDTTGEPHDDTIDLA